MTLQKELLLTIIVNSDKEHAPVKIQFKIPEQLAVILMSQPVVSVGLSISTPTGIIEDQAKFIDFSQL